jgi:hypothetical protein
VLIALLALALACLALGVIFASAPWLLASLATSVIAAIVLFRMRGRGASSTAPDTDSARLAQNSEARENGISARGQAGLLSGSAFESHAEPVGTGDATVDAAGSGDDDHIEDRDRDVWVIDSHPEYHAEGCQRLTDAGAEQIPRSQATEDGFVGCDSCRPDAAVTPDHSLRSPSTPQTEHQHQDEDQPRSPADAEVVEPGR